MTDYSKLSDFEINKLVARKLGFVQQGRGWITGADGIYDYIAKPNDDYRIGLPDYSNSWADAGPIIVENCISMVWDCAEDASSAWWNAVDQFDDCRVQYQSNPLRAAMIVFLMMNEGE